MHDIISRMEAMQSRFGQLQIEDRKDNRTDEQKAIGAYYDREMNRSDNGTLDYLSDDRAFDGEDAEAWQEQSERQGVE
jgi:hypothetical protein